MQIKKSLLHVQKIVGTDNFVQIDGLRIVNTRLAFNSQVVFNSETGEQRLMTNRKQFLFSK